LRNWFYRYITKHLISSLLSLKSRLGIFSSSSSSPSQKHQRSSTPPSLPSKAQGAPPTTGGLRNVTHHTDLRTITLRGIALKRTVSICLVPDQVRTWCSGLLIAPFSLLLIHSMKTLGRKWLNRGARGIGKGQRSQCSGTSSRLVM
jgi:hypothetical protein